LPQERLWAPWRLAYLQGSLREDESTRSEPSWLAGADENCFLCRDAATPADDRRNLVVWRGTETFAVLNRFPYNNGHLLVAPLDHKARLDQLSAAAHVEAMQLLARVCGIVEQKMNASGFNVGLNLGKSAGAGVPGHLHWHLVPRWDGDINFMPVTANVKVLPQALEDLWEMLSDALRSS
jgi:ATP adenylyltransferase